MTRLWSACQRIFINKCMHVYLRVSCSICVPICWFMCLIVCILGLGLFCPRWGEDLTPLVSHLSPVQKTFSPDLPPPPATSSFFFCSPFLLLYVLMLICHTLWLLPASRKHQKKHYSNCSDSYCTSFTAIDLKATRKLLYCWSFFRFGECLFFAAKSLFFSLWIY